MERCVAQRPYFEGNTSFFSSYSFFHSNFLPLLLLFPGVLHCGERQDRFWILTCTYTKRCFAVKRTGDIAVLLWS
jgi:hypothetical protein